MRILTSSWFSQLPPTIQKIGVSRGTPRGYPAGFRKMAELAPGPWFNTASERDYKQLYFDGLARLDARKTVAKIEELSAGKDAALLCYEKPTDNQYCHRAYISVWLKDELGLEVFEYGREADGCAWHHPKLPAQYRRSLTKPDPLDVSSYVGATAKDDQGRDWTIVGFDPENPDQAMMQSGGEKRAISAEVLKSRFQPVI